MAVIFLNILILNPLSDLASFRVIINWLHILENKDSFSRFANQMELKFASFYYFSWTHQS